MAKNVNLDNLNPNLKNIFDDDDTDDVSDIPVIEEAPEDLEEDPEEDSELGEEEDLLPEEDDDSEDPEKAVETVPAKKNVSSKEQEKIIALKRELREAKEKLTASETKAKVEVETQQLESLVSKYVGQGYDEDTSKYYAKTEFDMQDIKRQLAVSNFKADNSDLFNIYPDARTNAETIMAKMNNSGFTAKEVCSILYKGDTNPSKERAIQAVSGTLERKQSNNSVSNATRTPRSVAGALSEFDKKAKGKFEKLMGVEGLEDSEYVRLREQYGI